MHRPTRFEFLRLWLAENGELLGLIGAASAIVLVAAIVLGFSNLPLGPKVEATGTITSFGYLAGRIGPGEPMANVELADRDVVVTLLPGNACAVGGRIHLQRQRRLWGWSVTASWPPCDPTG